LILVLVTSILPAVLLVSINRAINRELETRARAKIHAINEKTSTMSRSQSKFNNN